MLNLRELRKRCGMTMKELGTQLGVAESTISQYETGKRQPDYETLLKLGEFFGVSVGYLLGEKNEQKAPTAGGERASDDEIKFALFGDSEIDDDLYEEVKAFAKFAKERKEKKG